MRLQLSIARVVHDKAPNALLQIAGDMSGMIVDGQGEGFRDVTFIFKMVQSIEGNAMFE